MIRNFEMKDETQVIDLWNRTLIKDNIDIKKFRRQAIFDDNFDNKLSFVVEEDEKIVAFGYATKRKFPYLERGLEPDRGWINVLFVDERYRNKGIGSSLLNCLEKELIKLSIKSITLCAYSPNYFFWGIDKDNYTEAINFFTKRNYKSIGEHFSMGKTLHGYQIPKDTLEKKKSAEELGYKFINFEYKYALELLDFLKEEFGGGWKRNALIAMQNERIEDVCLLVLNKDGKICGFSLRQIDENPMRFGPIGVSSKDRNMGLGSILLDLGMYEMSKKGIYRMFFVTTDEPGKRYYLRHDLEVIRTCVEFKKDI
ncbi:MAG: GNAT family N-acetyltransferase [Eubacteriales bacterium]|nr:GNAT family N-acetyltransferase [Eubacteriales bacterium]